MLSYPPTQTIASNLAMSLESSLGVPHYPKVFPKIHEVVGLTPLITGMLSVFLGIFYLSLQIPILSLMFDNKRETPFSFFHHKINKVTQKIMDNKAKADHSYLSVK